LVRAVQQNPLGECSPDLIAGFKGPTSKGREGTGRKGGWSEEGKAGPSQGASGTEVPQRGPGAKSPSLRC